MPEILAEVRPLREWEHAPAAAMRPSRIITAPSCSGALLKNMFFRSSAVVSAFMTVPVLMMEFNATPRSKMMSAPVLEADMSQQAWTVCDIAESMTVPLELRPEAKPLPMRSSSLLSSGWNRMSRAIQAELCRLAQQEIYHRQAEDIRTPQRKQKDHKPFCEIV